MGNEDASLLCVSLGSGFTKRRDRWYLGVGSDRVETRDDPACCRRILFCLTRRCRQFGLLSWWASDSDNVFERLELRTSQGV